MVVDVDGWMRSVAEVFEDLWRECVLERRASAGAIARRLLTNKLAEHASPSFALGSLLGSLARRAFSTWLGRSSRSAAAVRGAGVRVLRRAWSSWALQRTSRRRKPEEVRRLEAVVQAYSDPYNLCFVVFAAWRNSLVLEASSRSLEALSTLRKAIPASLLQVRLVGDEAMRHVCFLTWSRDVERSRRRSGDAFMLGQAGVMLDGMSLADRGGAAAELFCRFDANAGPEMRLIQLSSVVDGLMTNLDMKSIAPHLLPAARLAASPSRRRLPPAPAGSPGGALGAAASRPSVGGLPGSAVDEAVKAFEALGQARVTVRKLQTDIVYILQLRCLSAWLREVADIRIARGESALDGRTKAFETRMVAAVKGVMDQLAKHRLGKFLRDTFDEWMALTALVRALRKGGQDAIMQAQSQYEEKLMTARLIAFAAAKNYKLSLICDADQLALRIVWQRWAGQAAITRMSTSLDVALRLAEQQLQATGRTRERLQSLASRLGGRAAANFARCGAFLGWRSAALRLAHRRRQASFTEGKITMDTRQIKTAVFLAFLRGRAASSAQRFALFAGRRASEYAFGLGAGVVVAACFRVLATALHQRRGELHIESLTERCRLIDLRARARVSAGIAHATAAGAEALLRLCLCRWRSSTRQELDAERTAAAERRLRGLQLQSRMLRDRTKVSQLRAGERLGDALAVPLLLGVLAAWAQLACLAALERRAAGEWVRRQRRQEAEGHLVAHQVACKFKLQRMVEDVVRARASRAVPRIWDAWARQTRAKHLAAIVVDYRCQVERRCILAQILHALDNEILRSKLRTAGCGVAETLIGETTVFLLTRCFLAWLGSSSRSIGEHRVNKFLVLQKLVPIMARGPAKALQHWNWQVAQYRLAMLDGRSHLQRAEATHRLERICLREVFDAWSRRYRLLLGIVAARSWLARRALAGWRLSLFAERQERLQQQAERSGAVQASRCAADVAAKDRARRALAERRFARWYALGEEEGAAAPKCFAAWVLATLDAKSHLQADGITHYARRLGQSYRSAADMLLCRTATRFRNRALLLECWIELAAQCRHRGQHRIFKRQLRTTLAVATERLWARITGAGGAVAASCCFRAWATFMLELQCDQCRAFQQQATGLAGRLIERNSGSYAFMTLISALHAWRRCLLVRMRHLGVHLLHREASWSTARKTLCAWRLAVAFLRRPAGYTVAPEDREFAEEEFLHLACTRVRLHRLRRLAFAEAVLELRCLRLLFAFSSWSRLCHAAQAGPSRGRRAAGGQRRPPEDREPALRVFGLRALGERLICIILQTVILDWRRYCLTERSLRRAPENLMQDCLFALSCLRAWRSMVRGRSGDRSLAALGRSRLHELGAQASSYVERSALGPLRRRGAPQ